MSDLPNNLADLTDEDDDAPGAMTADEAPKKGKAAAKPAPKTASGPKMVKILLEDNDAIPPTGLFVSHNGKGYLIPVGRESLVPDFVVEILEHAVMSLPVIDPQTQQVMAYRDRMRYPFRRL